MCADGNSYFSPIQPARSAGWRLLPLSLPQRYLEYFSCSYFIDWLVAFFHCPCFWLAALLLLFANYNYLCHNKINSSLLIIIYVWNIPIPIHSISFIIIHNSIHGISPPEQEIVLRDGFGMDGRQPKMKWTTFRDNKRPAGRKMGIEIKLQSGAWVICIFPSSFFIISLFGPTLNTRCEKTLTEKSFIIFSFHFFFPGAAKCLISTHSELVSQKGVACHSNDDDDDDWAVIISKPTRICQNVIITFSRWAINFDSRNINKYYHSLRCVPPITPMHAIFACVGPPPLWPHSSAQNCKH